jgi:hypothetical protein
MEKELFMVVDKTKIIINETDDLKHYNKYLTEEGHNIQMLIKNSEVKFNIMFFI